MDKFFEPLVGALFGIVAALAGWLVRNHYKLARAEQKIEDLESRFHGLKAWNQSLQDRQDRMMERLANGRHK